MVVEGSTNVRMDEPVLYINISATPSHKYFRGNIFSIIVEIITKIPQDPQVQGVNEAT